MIPATVPVFANQRFDEAALARLLAAELGLSGPLVVRQFQGGQSNPTFHLAMGGAELVLRKKPPGTLLPSAHAVDREYRVLAALADTGVPVPTLRLMGSDPAVIGTIFYVMDYVPGRIFLDRALPELPRAERAAVYADMNRVMAALHRLDHRAIGLEGFGRAEGYIPRQIARWTRQYEASRWENHPAMERLIAWLRDRPPPPDETAVVHGDYRLGNLLIHPTEPRVVAVLDWELATIGHPLADLAYTLLTYCAPASAGGLDEAAMVAAGLPSQAEYVAQYRALTGRDSAEGLDYAVVFAMFRLAAIVAGVYRRGLDGIAADPTALTRATMFRELADRAWAMAERLPPSR